MSSVSLSPLRSGGGQCLRTSLNKQVSIITVPKRHDSRPRPSVVTVPPYGGSTSCNNFPYLGGVHYRSLKELKRNLLKRDWPPYVSYRDRFDRDEEEAELYVKDRMLGRIAEVKYALNNYHLTCTHGAYRNLHPSGILHLSADKPDKNKALHVNAGEDKVALLYGEKAPPSDPQAKFLPFEVYKNHVGLYKQAVIMHTHGTFMHDGALGSHPLYEVKARIFSDNASVALYLYHVIPRVQIGRAIWTPLFTHDVSIYLFSSPKSKTKPITDFGVKEESQLVVDAERHLVYLGGTFNTKAIRAAIQSVVFPRLLVVNDAAPLNAAIISVKDAEQPVLVFGDDDIVLNPELGLDIIGGHACAWGSEGVVRVYDGVTVPFKNQPLHRYDLVEHYPDGVVRVTSRREPHHNLHRHPAALVFVVNDKTNVLPTVSKIAPEFLHNFLLAGYSSGPLFGNTPLSVDSREIAAKAVELAKAHGVPAYVINVSSKSGPLANEHLKSLITSIGKGQAKDASSLSNVFTKLSPLTSVKGVTATLEPTKNGWSLNELKTEAAKLEASIADFVAKRFVVIPPLRAAPAPTPAPASGAGAGAGAPATPPLADKK